MKETGKRTEEKRQKEMKGRWRQGGERGKKGCKEVGKEKKGDRWVGGEGEE